MNEPEIGKPGRRPVGDEIDAGERWLAGFSTPGPSTEGLLRCKQRIRFEVDQHRDFGSARSRWTSAQGVLAAAAAIALAVTIAWHSWTESGMTRGGDTAAETVAWPNETSTEIVAFTDLDQQLTALEAWSEDEAWDVSGATLYDAIATVLNEASEKDPDEIGTRLRSQNRFIPSRNETGAA